MNHMFFSGLCADFSFFLFIVLEIASGIIIGWFVRKVFTEDERKEEESEWN